MSTHRAFSSRSRPALRLWALAALVLLTACSSDVTTPGEALRIVGSGLDPAYVGIAYEAPIQAVGGLRPYAFSVVDGVLPAGLSLQGGTLRGTPSGTGSATFTVQVSDANLSKTVQRFTMQVTEIPPPRLSVATPLTQVQRRLTVRGTVQGARDLEGLSTRIEWDAERFRLVDGSLRSSRSSVAMLSDVREGSVQLDLVPLGTVLNGDVELFRFDLEPVAEPNFLELQIGSVFASTGRRTFALTREGRPATTSPSTEEGDNPLDGSPANDPPSDPVLPEDPGSPGEPGLPGLPGLPDDPGSSSGGAAAPDSPTNGYISLADGNGS